MRNVFALIFLLLVVLSFAVAKADQSETSTYVELQLPKNWIQNFNASSEFSGRLPVKEKKDKLGWVGLEWGTALHKNIMITLDGHINGGESLGELAYSYDQIVSPSATVDPAIYGNNALQRDTACYSRNSLNTGYYWNNRCHPCPGVEGTCVTQNVYVRDAYIREEMGSLALGISVPWKIAQRWALEGGVSARLHFIEEGIRSNDLHHTTPVSFGPKAKLVFNLNKSGSLAFATGGEAGLLGRVKFYKLQIGLRGRLW